MKHVLAPTLLVGLLTLGACAHSDETALAPPSTLSSAEIRAELAAISTETTTLQQGRPYVADRPSVDRPIVLHVSDSNGVPLTTPTPDHAYLSPVSRQARPWGYARLDRLAKREAELFAELGRRTAQR